MTDAAWSHDPATLLAAVLARTPMAVFAMDATGVCTLSTGHGLQRVGLRDDELVGTNLLELYGTDPLTGTNFRQALAGEAAQYSWQGADGQELDTWLEPVRSPDGKVVGAVGVSVDATDRSRAEASERRRQEDQRALLHQVVQVQDAERRRMSAGLHDDTVQVLAAAGLRLALARRQVRDVLPDVADDLDRLAEDVTSAGQRLRRIVGDADPQGLAELGLVDAVSDLLERTFGGTGTATRMDAAGSPDGVVAPDAPETGPARALYLIAVEALTNVRRHARASKVTVEIEPSGGWWVLRVVDDGVGMKPGVAGDTYGLSSMRQRAEAAGGSLELLATSGGGTTVQAVVPTRVGYLEASRDLAPTAGVDVRAPLDHILESVTDAFVALDVDWHYVYVNRRAAELFGRPPDELIGRHIWTEFPEGVGQTFYHAYYRAAAEQRTIELEDYYPPWDRWFVNRIYPSPRGLTIFFHDVTEAHRQARRLDERELGSALLSELLATLSVTVDLPDALHAAAEGIAGLDGVRGVSLSAGGVDVCHGELPDESAQRHRVFVGDVEAGAVTIAWQGVDDDWARYLGSAVARTIATRLAPGNPLTPRPVGSA